MKRPKSYEVGAGRALELVSYFFLLLLERKLEAAMEE